MYITTELKESDDEYHNSNIVDPLALLTIDWNNLRFDNVKSRFQSQRNGNGLFREHSTDAHLPGGHLRGRIRAGQERFENHGLHAGEVHEPDRVHRRRSVETASGDGGVHGHRVRASQNGHTWHTGFPRGDGKLGTEHLPVR